jgi:hypothetical protein
MDQLTPDERFTTWTTDDLERLYRMRLRRLLIFETQRAPLRLVRRQERMLRQAWRLLRARGVELPLPQGV